MTAEGQSILIVEDEVEIADLLALHLGDLGANVTTVNDGHQGMLAINQQHWDIAILDIQLPGPSGLELCRTLRTKENYTCIIMITSRSAELDRVLGLELGADDYITKPFSVMELIARVKSQSRRITAFNQQNQKSKEHEQLYYGPLTIDVEARAVYLNDNPVDLTVKEFDLLVHFVKHPNIVFSRNKLLDQVWGYGHEGYEHTVNTHINRLRAKIESDSANLSLIVTVWGVGYKLQLPH